MNRFTQYPIFLAGFRPLFSLAMIAGVLLPLGWGLVFSGYLPWSVEQLNPTVWHAHEMLFGYGWAVMGGFLLTASKNWVKVRGVHGATLFVFSVLWIIERAVILFPGLFGGARSVLWTVLVNLYIVGVAGYILWTLLKYRNNDSYKKDNYFFYLILVLFLISKNLLLNANAYQIGLDMTVGLFRLAFAVMFERTMTEFMKGTESVFLYRNKYLDYSIKSLLLVSIFNFYFLESVAAIFLILAALLLFIRLLLWKPLIGLKKFGNAIMYVGYIGLVLHLILQASFKLGHTIGSTTTALHTFTFLCFGAIVSGMFVRICKGHTGRKPYFTTSDKTAIYFILFAAFFRLVVPPFFPNNYMQWILISGVLWSGCFLIMAINLIPLCLNPRIDGREH